MIEIHENTYGACGPAHRVSDQTECQGLNMWKFLAETPLFLIHVLNFTTVNLLHVPIIWTFKNRFLRVTTTQRKKKINEMKWLRSAEKTA